MRFETKKEMINNEKYRMWDNSETLSHIKYVLNNDLRIKKLKSIKFTKKKKRKE